MLDTTASGPFYKSKLQRQLGWSALSVIVIEEHDIGRPCRVTIVNRETKVELDVWLPAVTAETIRAAIDLAVSRTTS